MTSALAVARVAGRSVVTGARSESPLRLLVPRSPPESAWVFQSAYGGGFVGADAVALQVEVEASATLLLSSQASSKVYRAARSRYLLEARVGEAGALVSWPDPVVCFRDAALDQTLRFALGASASLLAVDTCTAGRLSRGERWAFERLSTRLEVTVAGRPWLRDAVLLGRSGHGALAARLEPAAAFATAALVGPRLEAASARVLAAVRAQPLRRLHEAPLLVASPRPGGLLLRAAATSTEALAAALRDLLGPPARELLGADPWERKW